MPFNNKISQLGDSKDIALRRFNSLERRLEKNSELKSQYVEFMREYENLKHMSKIEENSRDENNYYLPHHAVVRESAVTTKCRVVFDASAKTTTGISLNDAQFSGPTIQSDLFAILLRFRCWQYVMSADISKMYRQIMIDETQRNFQKMFWREKSSDPIQCYRLNTVTYGTSSAPFLATRCLLQLSKDNETKFPDASRAIKEDFYIDDLLTGCNSVTELLVIQKDITNILQSANFVLRKWLTNKTELLAEFTVNDDSEVNILNLSEEENSKTLGLYWNAHNDTIQYFINSNCPTIITKRSILSISAQIFDPPGLLSPITIRAKIILQRLWQAGVTWDEAVPQSVGTEWIQFRDNLSTLNELSIPRFIFVENAIKVEFHGFSDASESAYGACIYLRTIDRQGNISVHLLTAKTRVAPIKQLSLPRLELCAANLLASLSKVVFSTLRVNIDEKYFWCDSTITLGWIRGSANRWKSFVANRVGNIQTLSEPSDWRHVQSKENPADLLTRGINAEDLVTSSLWWHGPAWLLEDISHWKTNEKIDNYLPEARCHVTIVEKFELFERYSCLIKLKRVTAYILRFAKNSKMTKDQRKGGPLSVSELNNSLNVLIRLAQLQSYPEEYRNLCNKRSIHTKSQLVTLQPFCDDNNIMRVGGRLQNSNEFSFNKKHPIILNSKHLLTKLIMRYQHLKLYHCGPQLLLASLRENYWPVAGRNLARKIVHSCVRCFRVKPQANQQSMGNLPEYRLLQSFPFSNVGVDYAGPIFIKDRKLRNAKLIKAYICVFVCMSVKALHLELVTDLSTEAFLATFKRFIARRGRPSNIYSDNGSNFSGASAQLKELFKFLRENSDEIGGQLAEDGITWHFIPPYSPNFGGIWEAGVKSAKFHLERVVGNLNLTYEDLLTVLIQIEGILNSCPITPLTSSPLDYVPLTPAHFLVGKPLTAIPEPDLETVPCNRLNKYQQQQQAIQSFWKRWHSEYIGELQTRLKWHKNATKSLKQGDMVVVKEDGQPPLQWKKGRVLQLHPGRDEKVRVATVRFSNGQCTRRATSKLCVLPIELEP